LADTSGALSPDVAFVKTTSKGSYAINGVDTGLYVIEGIDSANNRALIDSVHVTDKNAGKDLGPDTLLPGGAIKGKIRLSEGGDPAKVLILAYGTDKLAWPEPDGSFKVKNFAHGKYKLHIIPLLSEYNSLDTGAISVHSAETTDVGTLSLPFNGVPVPKNLSLSYDSLKQIVSLLWNTPASNKNFKGYTVFRRDIDSNNTLTALSRTLLTDTVFFDSSAIQDRKYEYAVACVDTLGNTGKICQGTTVTITSVIKIVSFWGDPGAGQGQLSDPQKIAVDDSGYVFVVDESFKRVQKFTINGTFVTEFVDTFVEIRGICTDTGGNVYVADRKNETVIKFSSSGTRLSSLPVTGLNAQDVTASASGDIFVLGESDAQNFIWKLGPFGNHLNYWQTGQAASSLTIVPDSVVYACGNNEVNSYSANTGALIHSSAIPYSASAAKLFDLAVSPGGNIIVTDIESDQIIVISASGGLLAKGGKFADLTGLAMDKDGNLYGAESGKNRIVKIKYE
jgi:hypothetical protein